MSEKNPDHLTVAVRVLLKMNRKVHTLSDVSLFICYMLTPGYNLQFLFMYKAHKARAPLCEKDFIVPYYSNRECHSQTASLLWLLVFPKVE